MPDAPERRRPPLRRERDALRVPVVELRAHVVEQQIGVRMELHPIENLDLRGSRLERRHVARRAADGGEELFAGEDLGMSFVAP